MKFAAGSIVVAVLVSSALACGGSQVPPAQNGAATGPAAGSQGSSQVAPPQQTASNVSISDEIRKRCGISDQDAYFRFDSANITAADHTPLGEVAKCFISGPLAGRSVKLVGRADPRGESDYNLTLGQSRADAVGRYLDARGMSKGKTLSTSRGSMDSSGTDESGWQHDRRVDVMLGD
ncbi:MAG TPA: OmpA family protein [Polyangiaceae bacterium]|jgi:peptidoglycan-associated lipoprotein